MIFFTLKNISFTLALCSNFIVLGINADSLSIEFKKSGINGPETYRYELTGENINVLHYFEGDSSKVSENFFVNISDLYSALLTEANKMRVLKDDIFNQIGIEHTEFNSVETKRDFWKKNFSCFDGSEKYLRSFSKSDFDLKSILIDYYDQVKFPPPTIKFTFFNNGKKLSSFDTAGKLNCGFFEEVLFSSQEGDVFHYNVSLGILLHSQFNMINALFGLEQNYIDFGIRSIKYNI